MARIVHLIRHAQSTFNVAVAGTPWIDPMLFDARLSPDGEAQVPALRERVAGLDIGLVATSPLTRAIQTARGAFAGQGIPIVVAPLLREAVGCSADIGRSPALLAAEFPDLAFAHLDDPWWHCDHAAPERIVVEPEAALRARIAAFLAWAATQPVAAIAAVGHGTLFTHMTGLRMNNCELVTIAL